MKAQKDEEAGPGRKIKNAACHESGIRGGQAGNILVLAYNWILEKWQ